MNRGKIEMNQLITVHRRKTREADTPRPTGGCSRATENAYLAAARATLGREWTRPGVPEHVVSGVAGAADDSGEAVDASYYSSQDFCSWPGFSLRATVIERRAEIASSKGDRRLSDCDPSRADSSHDFEKRGLARPHLTLMSNNETFVDTLAAAILSDAQESSKARK